MKSPQNVKTGFLQWSIEFVWDRDDAKWIEMYEQLVGYKKQYKYTCVSQKYKADPQLGSWVNNQRSYYKNENPFRTTDEIHQVKSIGFLWKSNHHSYNVVKNV